MPLAHSGLTLDVLALNEEVLGFTNIWYEPALKHAFTVLCERTIDPGITAPSSWNKDGSIPGTRQDGLSASHDLEDCCVIEMLGACRKDRVPSTASAVSCGCSEDVLADVRLLLDDERVPLIEGRLASIAANIP